MKKLITFILVLFAINALLVADSHKNEVDSYIEKINDDIEFFMELEDLFEYVKSGGKDVSILWDSPWQQLSDDYETMADTIRSTSYVLEFKDDMIELDLDDITTIQDKESVIDKTAEQYDKTSQWLEDAYDTKENLEQLLEDLTIAKEVRKEVAEVYQEGLRFFLLAELLKWDWYLLETDVKNNLNGCKNAAKNALEVLNQEIEDEEDNLNILDEMLEEEIPNHYVDFEFELSGDLEFEFNGDDLDNTAVFMTYLMEDETIYVYSYDDKDDDYLMFHYKSLYDVTDFDFEDDAYMLTANREGLYYFSIRDLEEDDYDLFIVINTNRNLLVNVVNIEELSE